MENNKPQTNQDFVGKEIEPKQTISTNKLVLVIVIASFLTGIITGLILYFWQERVRKEEVKNLEQKVISLEKQILTMEGLKVPSQAITSTPVITVSPVKGAELSEIKYKLPDEWEARIRVEQNDLFLSLKKHGGFLSIKVYPYDGKTSRREYYCRLTNYCTKATYFTPVNIGNISGYRADALDNSGGGVDYFGAKGDKFYIISKLSPSYPLDNYFDKTFQQVLDSLVF